MGVAHVLGGHHIEHPGFVVKLQLCLEQRELGHRYSRQQPHRNREAHHLCVEEVDVVGLGHRHTVVAIADEEVPAELHHLHCPIESLGEHQVAHLRPTAAQGGIDRQKRGGEVFGSVL